MSIILDALKKAEAERHLGQLPGLHTPQASTSELQSAPLYGRSRRVWFVVIGIVTLIAIAIAWRLIGHESPVAASFSPPVQLPAPAPAGSPVASSASAGLMREIPVPPPLLTPVVKFAPAVAIKSAPLAVASRASQSKQIPVQSAPEKIMMMAELPPELQRELPPLVIGGSMYSANATERMLLIDKRLLHEGDEVAPGLVLENLMPKEAILRIHGTRFRIVF